MYKGRRVKLSSKAVRRAKLNMNSHLIIKKTTGRPPTRIIKAEYINKEKILQNSIFFEHELEEV